MEEGFYEDKHISLATCSSNISRKLYTITRSLIISFYLKEVLVCETVYLFFIYEDVFE